jgi:hypothetical protein
MDQVPVPTTAVPKYASRTAARGKTEIGQREKVIGCVVWYVISGALNVEGAKLNLPVCYRQLCHAPEVF